MKKLIIFLLIVINLLVIGGLSFTQDQADVVVLLSLCSLSMSACLYFLYNNWKGNVGKYIHIRGQWWEIINQTGIYCGLKSTTTQEYISSTVYDNPILSESEYKKVKTT